MSSHAISNTTAVLERIAIAIVGISILFQPFIFSVPVNKYGDIGESGSFPIDCDGPDIVFLMLAPFAVLAAMALLYWIIQLFRDPLPRRRIGLVVTCFLFLLVSTKGREAWVESRRVAASVQCR